MPLYIRNTNSLFFQHSHTTQNHEVSTKDPRLTTKHIDTLLNRNSACGAVSGRELDLTAMANGKMSAWQEKSRSLGIHAHDTLQPGLVGVDRLSQSQLLVNHFCAIPNAPHHLDQFVALLVDYREIGD